MKEVIDLLEKIKKWILEEGGIVCPHKYGMCNHDNENCPIFCIDQILAKLREAPEPTEFTRDARRYADGIDVRVRLLYPNPLRDKLYEACAIIERQTERIAELEAVIERCIKAMAGSNCLELDWLTEVLKG